VIVHGVNYPYDQWVPHMERVTANVLRAARQGDALVVFPGNVYGFGAQYDAPLGEDAGMRPNSSKGRLRVKLEIAIKAATVDGKCRALIMRAGDYFGPTVRNGYVDRIFGRAAVGKPMQILGKLDIAHQWAYVPDLARLSADLIERPLRLAPFEVVHFRGTVADPQRSFLQAIAQAAGKPSLGISVLPWPVIWAMARFNALMREVYEMRYLFDHAVIIDDKRARALAADFVPTPSGQAMAATLASYGES
jgi:nucleoside-diphosphate-sugar epimerase